MGHWEQIGVENGKARERRAAWPRWRRAIDKHGVAALTTAGWIALLVIALRALSPI